MTDLPIVCTLSEEGLRARKQGLLAQVARRATIVTKIPAGYRFECDAGSDTLSLIATMIDAERQCCRFLLFELSVGPDLGSLTLTLTGPEGTQQFLEALLDAA
jgi:hypothetical protein